MEIKTKFSMNDYIWFMKDNKPTKGQIYYIEVKVKNFSNPTVYILYGADNDGVPEQDAYASKKELLESL